MIQFEKHALPNGLKVIVHTDQSSPLVAMNLLYGVGARNESPDQTGFAHLFEHLMFGGSANIPDYDPPLQEAGGENNAFTNNDFTNYYLTLPGANIEIGFWLESDRMNELAFSQNSLDVQKKVVIEEFRQRYLNQPYGDLWMQLRELAYLIHPYRWSTIGKEISHIETATLEDVRTFFFNNYAPNNAILVLTGNILPDRAFNLAQKWFGQIPARQLRQSAIPVEPVQNKARRLTLERPVPQSALTRVWHMSDRLSKGYYIADLCSDILASGPSSRFHKNLVHGKELFTDLDAYITGDRDPGLFVVSGHLNDRIDPEEAYLATDHEIRLIIEQSVTERELQKVKNRLESQFIFNQTHILHKAMNLAYFEWLGDASMIHNEIDIYQSISAQDVQNWASEIFREENSCTLNYLSNLNHDESLEPKT